MEIIVVALINNKISIKTILRSDYERERVN